jgi:hypothetical protein
MSTNRTLFWVLVGLNVLDVVTTKISLDSGATEANPLIGDNIIIIGLWKVIVLTIIWLLLNRIGDTKPWNAGLLTVIIVYSIVIGINIGGIACLNA